MEMDRLGNRRDGLRTHSGAWEEPSAALAPAGRVARNDDYVRGPYGFPMPPGRWVGGFAGYIGERPLGTGGMLFLRRDHDWVRKVYESVLHGGQLIISLLCLQCIDLGQFSIYVMTTTPLVHSD